VLGYARFQTDAYIAAEMTYAGNPSISPEVRQRILGTFEQTLQLAGEGSRQEALLGCDFVLRMDPQFEPARLLQERLKATTGPVRVDDLQDDQGPDPGAFQPPPLDDPFGGLDGLDLGFSDLPDLPGTLGDGGGLRSELQSLLAQRRFPELMAAAQREQAAVMADPELQRIVGEGQERMEAEPYVLKFLASARQALQAGQAAEAGRLLDKARSLDPGHPGIAELEAARQGQAAPSASPPAPEPVQFPPGFQTPVFPPSFDLDAVGGIGDSESQRRIRELLDEGQAALDLGDPQGAIDAWSRIFLIDIDNQEAARRIEAARRLKAETERQAEEVFHEGVSHLEAGDSAAARHSFERVLQLQPGHFAAREYLQQIDAGTAPVAKPAGPRDLPGILPEPPLPLPSDLDLADGLREEILVPPDPSEVPGGRMAAKTTSRAAAAARSGGEGRARRLFLAVGGIVLLLALAGGWLLLQNREELFPNSTPEIDAAGTGAALSQDPISRATRLQKAGKTAMAVAQLKRIPPNDSHYAEAQKLIAEWEGRPAAPAAAAIAPAAETSTAAAPAAAPGTSRRRQELLAAAGQAYGERNYLRALTRLEQAAALGKLAGEDARLLQDTRRKLVPIAQEIDLFRQHEWEFVLPRLWRLHEENPADRDVTQLIVDCYYNLGVRDLQRADAAKAAEQFEEALTLQPNDPLLRRHLLFAQTYEERPKDLLYRIYVKYLPFR
jgi:tetratricopeptide (TPR) repeat protein